MRHFVTSIAIFAFVCATNITTEVHAAPPADFDELLEARWFEIEMVVFERLDVLDANSAETLTLSGARSWPANLMEITTAAEAKALLDAREALLQDSSDRFDASSHFSDDTRCLGFPTDFYDTQRQMGERLGDLLRRDSPATDLNQTDAIARDRNTPAAIDADAPIAAPAGVDVLTPQDAPDVIPTPYQQFLADVATFEQKLWDSSYTWLENLTMVNEVKALNRQRNIRPLIHRRWRQSVPARSAPQPVYIASEISTSAPATMAGFAKIEGFVSVTVGRYLHFAPTLWFHADTLGLSPVAFPVRVPLAPVPTSQYMQLQESRRMRSEEWHYLDHPKFGVIVRIDPITVPAMLLDAHTNLIESRNQPLQ